MAPGMSSLNHLTRMSLDREETGEMSVSFPKLQDVASSREPSPPRHRPPWRLITLSI